MPKALPCGLPVLLSSILATSSASAIKIQLDYTYDTNNFFSLAQPERRAALEAAARFFEEILSDTLLRVNPADFPGSSWTLLTNNPQTGGSVSLPGFVVPEDTIVVFVGARELGGNVRGQAGPAGFSASGSSAWLARIRSRGNPGANFSSANSSLATDFAPKAGFISFDVTTDFNFSTTQNLSGTDFVSVALHEFCHILGVGTADSWDNLIDGSSFSGPASNVSAGGAPGIDTGGGHFAQTVSNNPSFGSFQNPHGTSSPVLMRPSLTTSSGGLTVLTDLDLAGLADIGWEVTPPLAPTFPSLGPASTQINWPSSSFRDYVIEKSTDLNFATGTQVPFAGDGSVLSWTDPAPAAGQAFYRLTDTAYTPPPAAAPAAPAAPAARSASLPAAPEEDEFMTDYVAPRWVNGCECGGH